MTALVLGVLAFVLAGPAPTLLSRVGWTAKVPRASVVLWQAMALAAVLAALGAGVAVTLDTIDRPDPGLGWTVIHVAAFTLTVVVAIRLGWSAARVAMRTRRRRARHRMLVDLLSKQEYSSAELRVLDETTPLAYCLPGVRDPRVVLSEGTLEHLDQNELRAVLAHERAHLRARHDLVLEAFTMLREAFPLPTNRAPLEQSGRLVEMLADDAARKRVGPVAVARALVALAHAPIPKAALGLSGTATVQRVQRLAEPDNGHRLLAFGVYAVAAAIVVVPTLTVAVPLLSRIPDALALWWS